MLLEILNTTDGLHVGHIIDSDRRPVTLSAENEFTPDRVWQLTPGCWRLANANYVIDAKEVNHG